ncbi:hypothetical protein SPI_03419 [Niveomyces insectorum RCEF 264]|uniref:Uncharacterized protein n=1 Tax=Niveomyces insectorum RCEF 264 TaxID=1081102 RepID=A0A167W2I2_9HYPO|nr:hypothetical protein SPI_03419 [Niveomyces insectorum RCEF 264]
MPSWMHTGAHLSLLTGDAAPATWTPSAGSGSYNPDLRILPFDARSATSHHGQQEQQASESISKETKKRKKRVVLEEDDRRSVREYHTENPFATQVETAKEYKFIRGKPPIHYSPFFYNKHYMANKLNSTVLRIVRGRTTRE